MSWEAKIKWHGREVGQGILGWEDKIAEWVPASRVGADGPGTGLPTPGENQHIVALVHDNEV